MRGELRAADDEVKHARPLVVELRTGAREELGAGAAAAGPSLRHVRFPCPAAQRTLSTSLSLSPSLSILPPWMSVCDFSLGDVGYTRFSSLLRSRTALSRAIRILKSEPSSEKCGFLITSS